jgi:hypothetical protein
MPTGVFVINTPLANGLDIFPEELPDILYLRLVELALNVIAFFPSGEYNPLVTGIPTSLKVTRSVEV